jgi:S-adenosylmethionine:tRNA ribosyltransferase-isomerase
VNPGGLPVDSLRYILPPELIAPYPAKPRDQSRLMVIDRSAGTWHHETFASLADWLGPGDCLVLNRTRVRKARTPARRATGGRVEILWLSAAGSIWRALARPAGRLRPGEVLVLEHGLEVTVTALVGDGLVLLKVPDNCDFEAHLDQRGHVPLPPYVKRPDEPEDRENYQTVFARELGAAAAPTAGLHFTARTFESLRQRRIDVAEIVLHVGPGTFRPIQSRYVHEHRLDPEWYDIPESSWIAVQDCRQRRSRVVAVGTTVVRALETAAATSNPALTGWSSLLIAPPFSFCVADALLTNFHLPGSTLLALVAAFAGLDLTLEAYQAAVQERYRFYSYGDAMLIL